eukprot:7437338-Alexandrium_andersonii.AAC.1
MSGGSRRLHDRAQRAAESFFRLSVLVRGRRLLRGFLCSVLDVSHERPRVADLVLRCVAWSCVWRIVRWTLVGA